MNSARALQQQGVGLIAEDPATSRIRFNQAAAYLDDALRNLHNSCRAVLRDQSVRDICRSEVGIIEFMVSPLVGGSTRQQEVRNRCGLVAAFNSMGFSSLVNTTPIQAVVAVTDAPNSVSPGAPTADCETSGGEQQRRRRRPPPPAQQAPAQAPAALTPEQQARVRELMAAQEERNRRQAEEREAERRRRNRRPPQVRSEQVIRAELDSALARADAAGSNMIPPDVDFFLSRAELSARTRRPPITQGQWEDAVRRWNNSMARYDAIARDESLSIDERRGRVINALVTDYLTNYCRDSADPLGVLLGGCGNCQVRLHAINAVLSRNPHLIPFGYQLGMAVSTKHVEAVLISTNPAQNEVYLDLLTNQRYDHRERDVFTPITSVRTFLQGRRSVVESRDLLARRSAQILASSEGARGRRNREIAKGNELRSDMQGSQEYPTVEDTDIDSEDVPLRATNTPPPVRPQVVTVPAPRATGLEVVEPIDPALLRRVAHPQRVLARVASPGVAERIEDYIQDEDHDEQYKNFLLNLVSMNPDITLPELRTAFIRYTDQRIQNEMNSARSGMWRPVDGMINVDRYGLSSAFSALGVEREQSAAYVHALDVYERTLEDIAHNPQRVVQLVRTAQEQRIAIEEDGLNNGLESIQVFRRTGDLPTHDPVYSEPSIDFQTILSGTLPRATVEQYERIFTNTRLFGYRVPEIFLTRLVDIEATSSTSAEESPVGQHLVRPTGDSSRPYIAPEALEAATAQYEMPVVRYAELLWDVYQNQIARNDMTAARATHIRYLTAEQVASVERLVHDPGFVPCSFQVCGRDVLYYSRPNDCASEESNFRYDEDMLCPEFAVTPTPQNNP